MAFSSFVNARLVGRFGMRRLSHGALLGFLAINALWLALTAIYVLGWAVAHWVAHWVTGGSGRSLAPDAEALVLFAVVPPVQVVALWVVATVRHARRSR